MNLAAQVGVASTVKAERPLKLIIELDGKPPGALLWLDKKSKAQALHSWRRGLSRTFAERARALRVAWALEWLFTDAGFAYASDAYLEHETGLPLNKVQAGLSDLESGGAIIRAHVWIDGKLHRRIFPATAVALKLHPTVGGSVTPQGGPKAHPTVGGLNTYRTQNRISSTLIASRMDAQRREARERGEA
jgi:hypothetical protein